MAVVPFTFALSEAGDLWIYHRTGSYKIQVVDHGLELRKQDTACPEIALIEENRQLREDRDAAWREANRYANRLQERVENENDLEV